MLIQKVSIISKAKIGVACVSILIGQVSVAATARADAAQFSCNRIDSVYRACGNQFHYNRTQFAFQFDKKSHVVACTDGRDLSFYDRIEDMDIASILLIPYQFGSISLPETRQNHDPGRLRSEELLKATYGSNESEVRAHLIPVVFLGQKIRFQKNLGAAAALQRVSEELLKESKINSSLDQFLKPWTQQKIDLRFYAFAWRTVKGTSRLSTHSFGTGIDLNVDKGPQYWLWDEQSVHPNKAAQGEDAYRNDHFIPRGPPQFHAKAVEIFERNGFIWGGKWNHYDTMHFEYRPEFNPNFHANCNIQTVETNSLLWFASTGFDPRDESDEEPGNDLVCDH